MMNRGASPCIGATDFKLRIRWSRRAWIRDGKPSMIPLFF